MTDIEAKYIALLAACQPIADACRHDDLLVDREHAILHAGYRVIVISDCGELLTTAHLYAIAEMVNS